MTHNAPSPITQEVSEPADRFVEVKAFKQIQHESPVRLTRRIIRDARRLHSGFGSYDRPRSSTNRAARR
jgi:hypothetical protein